MKSWEDEQREYYEEKMRQGAEGARLLGWFGILLVVLAVIAALSGCSSCPADELRVVHPIKWEYLNATDLKIMCRDYTVDRGCAVSRFDGDTIYVLER